MLETYTTIEVKEAPPLHHSLETDTIAEVKKAPTPHRSLRIMPKVDYRKLVVLEFTKKIGRISKMETINFCQATKSKV